MSSKGFSLIELVLAFALLAALAIGALMYISQQRAWQLRLQGVRATFNTQLAAIEDARAAGSVAVLYAKTNIQVTDVGTSFHKIQQGPLLTWRYLP